MHFNVTKKLGEKFNIKVTRKDCSLSYSVVDRKCGAFFKKKVILLDESLNGVMIKLDVWE